MSDWKKGHKGLANNASSPGSIANRQHHDPSLSEKDVAGSPGTPDQIISDANTGNSGNGQHVENFAVIRVLNTNVAIQFLFIGKEGDVPGAPAIGDSIAIAPNFYENFYLGQLEADESIFIKSSSDDVQVVVFKS